MRSTKELYEIAAKYRGNVLNEVTWLEKFVDSYIANYFTSDELKTREMHLLFLGDNRMSFESKKQIFMHLASTYDCDWLKAYKSFRTHPEPKKVYTMNNDLDYLTQQRNVLAHRIVDTTDDGRNDNSKIRFLTYKNKEDIVPFGHDTYTELMFMLKDLTKYIYERIEKK